MENTPKPRIVITSNSAKEHVAQAKAFMEEMKHSMSIQRQVLEGKRTKEAERSAEEQRYQSDKAHESSLQREKLQAAKVSI